jgi:hypothetical protein
MFEIFIFWLIFSFVVGLVASDRKLGFGGGLLLSLLLSPIIGFIVAVLSPARNPQPVKLVDKDGKPINTSQFTVNASMTKEQVRGLEIQKLLELEGLKDRGVISTEEFDKLKSVILSGVREDIAFEKTNIEQVESEDTKSSESYSMGSLGHLVRSSGPNKHVPQDDDSEYKGPLADVSTGGVLLLFIGVLGVCVALINSCVG